MMDVHVFPNYKKAHLHFQNNISAALLQQLNEQLCCKHVGLSLHNP